jgi:hypothetical protein
MEGLTVYKVILIVCKTLYKYSIFFILFCMLTMESAHIGLEGFVLSNFIGMLLSLISSLPYDLKKDGN